MNYLSGMKRTKKSCGGDVRAAPRGVSAEKSDGKQAPPSDFFITPTVGSWRSPLTSPPHEEKSRLAKKKVGFAEKKLPKGKLLAYSPYNPYGLYSPYRFYS